MRLPSLICLLALAGGCSVSFDPISTGDDPFGDFTPPPEVTPAPPVVVDIPPSDVPLRGPDGGFVATNEGRSWSDLAALSDGEVFAAASVIEVRGTLREWMLPSDGSDSGAAGTGTWAGYVSDAIGAGRYAAIHITGARPEDLPPAWPTTTDPPGVIANGVISLLTYGEPPGDDDDSAGDDDDSAGDDDDSAARTPREVVQYIDWSDPDLFSLHGSIVQALGARFADQPGLAFVTVGGVGEGGRWQMPAEVPPVGPGGLFTAPSWVSVVGLYTELYRGSFRDVPAAISWTVLRDAGPNREALESVLAGDEVSVRDDCFGGCTAFAWDRFPGEGGEPYPSADPFGGWIPGELVGVDVTLGGGLGGIGGWRRADVSGSWDAATFGTPGAHLDRMMQVAQRHAPPRWVSLGETACLSSWALAAAPSGASCAQQVGLWTELDKHRTADGDRLALGPRPEVRRVSAPANWRELGSFVLTIELTNAGGAPLVPRDLEVRLVEDAGAELVAASLPASALAGGEASSLDFDLFVPSAATVTGAVQVQIRIPEPRAFGGFVPLPQPADGDGWSVLATLPAAG